ncbi:hypothetical protein [Burkholderia gladioli]|uniref:hypothetical protein n=1 Tax=Burkholderia gladioli TaxID=28095 RepID=UPI0016409EB0|nr:hypothetical protein [Burkholderia gladioli]MBU9174044.1 hypothetical protein [Burkholderia gladioli]
MSLNVVTRAPGYDRVLRGELPFVLFRSPPRPVLGLYLYAYQFVIGLARTSEAQGKRAKIPVFKKAFAEQ